MDRNVKKMEPRNPSQEARRTYEWQPEDLFQVTGAEITIWNQALSMLIQQPEHQKAMIIQQAAGAMGAFLREAISSGAIKEKIVGEPIADPTAPSAPVAMEVVAEEEAVSPL